MWTTVMLNAWISWDHQAGAFLNHSVAVSWYSMFLSQCCVIGDRPGIIFCVLAWFWRDFGVILAWFSVREHPISPNIRLNLVWLLLIVLHSGSASRLIVQPSVGNYLLNISLRLTLSIFYNLYKTSRLISLLSKPLLFWQQFWICHMISECNGIIRSRSLNTEAWTWRSFENGRVFWQIHRNMQILIFWCRDFDPQNAAI